MRPVLYFAYGSNLDDEQMRARCASAQAVARAALPNHTLTFGGFSQRWGGAVASVARARGARVEGLLYQLADADLRALDRFEGHPFAYTRVVKRVLDEQGRQRRVMLYLQLQDPFVPWEPPPGYYNVLRRAYDRLGFDVAALAAAALGRS
jgi:gamma-glutamylcyclotransferase